MQPDLRQRLTDSSTAPWWIPFSALAFVLVISWSGPLAYPLRLFTTIVHELSHGVAAIISGGEFVAFRIAPDGSGLAYTRGGLGLLITPAGYLGAALIGTLLIRLGDRPRGARRALTVLGLLIALLTLRYALPTLFSADVLFGLLTLVSGIGSGSALVWAAFRFSERWNHWLLTVLGIWLGLSALEDLLVLLTLSSLVGGLQLQTDAAAMAAATGIPALIWALLWLAVALWAVGSALFGRLWRRD